MGGVQVDVAFSENLHHAGTIPGKKSYEHTGRGTAQRYAMIEELSVQFRVKESCAALSVSRSGYYRWAAEEPSLRAKDNTQFVPANPALLR